MTVVVGAINSLIGPVITRATKRAALRRVHNSSNVNLLTNICKTFRTEIKTVRKNPTGLEEEMRHPFTAV
jgi:hypothetical protein